MTIEMTDTFAEKLLELGVIDLPEGARLSGPTKEQQVADAMSNALCDLMGKKNIIKLNEFGGFVEPSFDDMTIHSCCLTVLY